MNQPDLAAFIDELLTKLDIAPHNLELEFSEKIVFQDTYTPLLLNLRKMGMRMAIDDFGIGYSSLSRLTEIPFDTIKIDQSFARKVSQSDKDVAVISGILHLANSLGANVICEGVETNAELDIYMAEGCTIVQGNYYSPAIDVEMINVYGQ